MVRMEITVQEDVDNCENVLNSRNVDKAKKLCEYMISIYGGYIENIRDGLDAYDTVTNYDGTDCIGIDYLGDLRKIKRKLELFKASNCAPTSSFRQNTMPNVITKISNNNSSNNSSNNSNTNTNSITNSLEILFEETKKEFENNGFLPPEEIEEILQKIDEIKEVHVSEGSKNNKWQKLRGIVSWTATKGIVVAASVLNLITAVLKTTC